MKSHTPEELKQIIIERSYPEPNTGCWLWGFSVNFFGYGILKARQLSPKIVTAHRASYWLFNGPFDLTMHVLHKCDTPCCVNPEHLFLGTHIENIADRTRKGRSAKNSFPGTKSATAKITEEIALQIRSEYSSGFLNQYELAKKYGVNQPSISYVISRKTWKHV